MSLVEDLEPVVRAGLARRLSQNKLAAELGVSQKTIARVHRRIKAADDVPDEGPTCELCAVATSKVLRFGLTRQEASKAGRGRTTRGAGSISLCARCWKALRSRPQRIGRPTVLTVTEQAAVLDAHAAGATAKELAQRWHVSLWTVYEVLRTRDGSRMTPRVRRGRPLPRHERCCG